jgi:hypothetical protein
MSVFPSRRFSAAKYASNAMRAGLFGGVSARRLPMKWRWPRTPSPNLIGVGHFSTSAAAALGEVVKLYARWNSLRSSKSHDEERRDLLRHQVGAGQVADGVGGGREQVDQVVRLPDRDHRHAPVRLCRQRATVDLSHVRDFVRGADVVRAACRDDAGVGGTDVL